MSKKEKSFDCFISDLVAELDYDIWKDYIWSDKLEVYTDQPFKGTRMREFIDYAKERLKVHGLKYE